MKTIDQLAYAKRVEERAWQILQDWEPSERPHCSNCLHAIVSGEFPASKVRCEAGYATGERRLVPMIRKGGRGLSDATKCPGFSSMD